MITPVALPNARGPLSAFVLDRLSGRATTAPATSSTATGDAVADDDVQLALYLCYELHYLGFPHVADGLEWDPGLIGFRSHLEQRVEASLRALTPPMPDTPLAELVPALVAAIPGPSLSTHFRECGTLQQMREFVIHRSAYQLKEADPHTWAIPRLVGTTKQRLVQIQAGEYGADGEGRIMHAELYASTMRALGLDERPNAYLDVLPGQSLAISNLVSMFGLQRRLRAALVGHLALFEMTSVDAMRSYVAGLVRMRAPAGARRFYDVHVLADAEHEGVALEMIAGLLAGEPALMEDVVFGISAALVTEQRFGNLLLDHWRDETTSLPRAIAA